MAERPAPVTLFEGRRLRATWFPGRSDRTIVTFDWRQEGREGFAPLWHATSFARQGFGQVTIRTAANDWFLNDETEALEGALSRWSPHGGRVQMLGFSMGAYGALRLARALGARQVVAVSPQSGLEVAWDRRYPAEAASWPVALGHLGARAVPGLRGLLVFDPFVPEDRCHAARILGWFPALRPVRLGFGGHPAIRVLRGAGGMRLLQEQAGARSARAEPILAAHRAARRSSRGWWLRLARQAGERRPALAARARERASTLAPHRGDEGPEG
ncbi:alpha/beta hydrolase [Rubellimicrobium sp. CFH 75288]|uniref:alpha/beta hydrolase n=1 Tax=Rubellimicrobium sp. CFH 75288 TaxID=2697034 RepID=UPI001412F860|nr:alpha/beta hydrolase [Rubellimicrobium sp. CFH 75288]NAZ36429.1 alpha/beta hydrolase [Rubellimicrobium sp. CFH 75288]